MDAEILRQYLEFYQDLGIKTLYRQPAELAGGVPSGSACPTPIPVPTDLPPLAPTGDTLLKIIEDIGDCHRCRLSAARNKIVFGVGNPQSPLVFVGEGPGADEDAQGIPFVGRAGQLLTQMIEGTAKKEGIELLRKDIYIANVVKCRPPENRTPEPDEMEICGQFLHRQLLAIRSEEGGHRTPPQGHLHRQRGEVPSAGESHAGAGRNGDLRPVPAPAAPGDPPQGRRRQDARQVVPVAGYSRNGHVPPVVPAAAVQSGRQARGLGRPQEGAALRVRLRGSGGRPRLRTEIAAFRDSLYCLAKLLARQVKLIGALQIHPESG